MYNFYQIYIMWENVNRSGNCRKLSNIPILSISSGAVNLNNWSKNDFNKLCSFPPAPISQNKTRFLRFSMQIFWQLSPDQRHLMNRFPRNFNWPIAVHRLGGFSNFPNRTTGGVDRGHRDTGSPT